jgi:hypothetical protein
MKKYVDFVFVEVRESVGELKKIFVPKNDEVNKQFTL